MHPRRPTGRATPGCDECARMDRRAVFLDFDDTLHDFTGAYRRALLQAVTPVCLAADPPCSPAWLAERCAVSWADIWELFVGGKISEASLWAERSASVLTLAGVAPDAALTQAVHRGYLEGMDAGLQLYPETTVALGLLHEARPRPVLGLLTNGPALVQRARLTRLGLADRFMPLVISGELGCAKPDPRFFATALEQADVPPHAAVMIGDNPVADVAGARHAGLRAIWLNRGSTAWPRDAGPAPDAVCGDLTTAVRLALDWLGATPA